jgi:hypothetical protein
MGAAAHRAHVAAITGAARRNASVGSRSRDFRRRASDRVTQAMNGSGLKRSIIYAPSLWVGRCVWVRVIVRVRPASPLSAFSAGVSATAH